MNGAVVLTASRIIMLLHEVGDEPWTCRWMCCMKDGLTSLYAN
jgi:hypothetical protein